MKNAQWLALLVALAKGIPAFGQLTIAPGLLGPSSLHWARGSDFYLQRHYAIKSTLAIGPSVSVSAGNPYYRPAAVRISLVNFGTPFVVQAAPIVLVAAPRRLANEILDDLGFDVAPVRRVLPVPVPIPQELVQGQEASVFRPILPKDRREAARPVPRMGLPMPQPAEPKRAGAPAPPKKAVPPREAPAPAVDAREENARQIDWGSQAFALQEYGRAQRRFQQAVAFLPDDFLAYFLLAETQYAQGKYQEAVASIEAGMRLRADWPMSFFRPRELYRMNAGDHEENLKKLAAARAKHPNDPVLVFLNAYQLWFDDRQWEAWLLFGRAQKLAADPGPSQRFLQHAPPGPFPLW